MSVKLNPSTARQNQATLRAYEASRQRLVAAANEDEIVAATEEMLAAKANHKRSVKAAVDELLGIAKGEGGYSFFERVDAFLKVEPDATASRVSDETGIGHAEVMSIFEQRKAEGAHRG